MGTQEKEIVVAFLVHAAIQGPEKLGISQGLAENLRSISITTLKRALDMCSRSDRAVRIEVDEDCVQELIETAQQESEHQERMKRLIQLDASYDMIQALYGMSKREYTTLRQKNRREIEDSRKRPRPDERIINEMYQDWKAMEPKSRIQLSFPIKQWIDWCEKYDISAKSAWRIVIEFVDIDAKLSEGNER